MFDNDKDIGGDTKAKTQQQRLDDDFDIKPTVEKSNPNKRKRVDKEDEMEILNQIGVIDEDNNPPRKREKKSFTMPGQIRDPPDEVPTSEMPASCSMDEGIFQNLQDELVIEIFTKLSDSNAPFDTLGDLKSLGKCSAVCKRFNSLVSLVPTLSIHDPSCKTLYDYCPKILNKFKHISSLKVKHWSCAEIHMNKEHRRLPTVYFEAAYEPHSYCLLVVSYMKASYYSDLQVRDSLMISSAEDGEVSLNASSFEHACDLFRLHHMLVSSIKDHKYLQTVMVTDFTNRGTFTLEKEMLSELRNCNSIYLKPVQGCYRYGSSSNLDFSFGSDLHGVVLNDISFRIMEWCAKSPNDPIHEAEDAAAGIIPTGLPFRGSRGVLLKSYLQSLLRNPADVHVGSDAIISGILTDLHDDGNLL